MFSLYNMLFLLFDFYDYKITYMRPWPGGSVGWSIVPYTKRLWVQSPVRAHMGDNPLMFLSHVDVSRLPPPQINKPQNPWMRIFKRLHI